MEQQQINLVQTGFRHVMATRDLFALDFYSELFRLAPELRQQFPLDMSKQRSKISESLIIIIHNLGNDREIREYLQALGKKHSTSFQTKPEHYTLFKKALMATLTYQLGELWTRDMRDAWSVAIDRINAYMN